MGGTPQSKVRNDSSNASTGRSASPLPITSGTARANQAGASGRWANKTHKLEREHHGKAVAQTIQRHRQAPPADVLARMSGEKRRMDKVVRSVSEVGNGAQVKQRLSHKLGDAGASKGAGCQALMEVNVIIRFFSSSICIIIMHFLLYWTIITFRVSSHSRIYLV
ncbi:hypothetical protein FIBSPDRAFT_850034 [Athelia psychrophila]|uniref:Uncharacterized protein n=1 Tax=Athelia psychrophila TaxID=1759441 RepID=A0A166TW25_9AGAM|nr:hypothetical protein FIBSPDRAFT_850034 [Fibularhizoctonia sp. CBS 109695]